MKRRYFLRTAGAAAAGLSGLPSWGSDGFPPWPGANAQDALAAQDPAKVGAAAGGRRIAVFIEDAFPADESLIRSDGLKDALKGFDVDFLGADQLAETLDISRHALYLNPYGSRFPRNAWSAILRFLSAGGRFINLGGVPFTKPMVHGPGGWVIEPEKSKVHRELGILHWFEVQNTGSFRLGDASTEAAEHGRHRELVESAYSVKKVIEIYPRFTATRDFPGEDGTAGQRDATIRPIVGWYTTEGDLAAAPVVMIDRMLGPFGGGRWILANYEGGISGSAVAGLVSLAVGPVLRISAEPTFAAYLPGETPAILLRTHNPIDGSSERDRTGWKVTVSDDEGRSIFEKILDGDDVLRLPGGALVLPDKVADALKPGFYKIDAWMTHRRALDGQVDYSDIVENGFWVYDDNLMRSGKPLEVKGNYLQRDGNPFPVCGTSYMSEGVQRKFLFEPNPALWEKDFSEMTRTGINMVRTGLWTGWKNVMLDVGSPDERVLRALDAFVLTSRRHDIPIIFTFFAFVPESWGGENPYLDPRSVQAQKTFIAAIADRYRNVPGIIWDLINEPSFSSPSRLWETRPNYDRHEEESWAAWHRSRHAAADSLQPAGAVDTLTAKASGDSLRRNSPRDEFATGAPPLPPVDEFRDRNIIGSWSPESAFDYRMFAQERFRDWVKEMRSAIAGARPGAAKPRQLLTVGQDEGGTYERPAAHFFADEVDLTSLHNWWFNDDLLWDSHMTSVPGKPNLVQETGVMFYETSEGRPWRTEADARDLLERKLASSFGAGGAGFIHWLWNTNPYMFSDNEAAIGMKRADGSLKPESGVIRNFARFFKRHAARLSGKVDEEAVLVIPHSNLFSVRNSATEATRAAVRAMEYHCGIPLRTCSEYGLDRINAPPKLFILPSPGVFDTAAWERLTAFVSAGSRLVVTGVIDRDARAKPVDRSGAFRLMGSIAGVRSEEHVTIGGREFRVGFRGEKLHRIEKFTVQSDGTAAVREIPVGAGEVIYSPLPLEVSDSIEAAAALYAHAASRAGIVPPLTVSVPDPSVLARAVVFDDAILATFISETSSTRRIEYRLAQRGVEHSVEVPAGRAVVRFHRRGSGEIIDTLQPT